MLTPRGETASLLQQSRDATQMPTTLRQARRAERCVICALTVDRMVRYHDLQTQRNVHSLRPETDDDRDDHELGKPIASMNRSELPRHVLLCDEPDKQHDWKRDPQH